MYIGKFGRCGFPYFGPGSRMARPYDFKRNSTPSCPHHGEDQHACFGGGHGNSGGLRIKSSSLGGLVLPEGRFREAAYHVASLNLDTSGFQDFIVLLNFSCNITSNIPNLYLRFQMFKQEKYQLFPVPVSSGILYARKEACMESNAFTLSACDCDSMASSCCCYSVCAQAAGAGDMGTGLVANPVLTASIMDND